LPLSLSHLLQIVQFGLYKWLLFHNPLPFFPRFFYMFCFSTLETIFFCFLFFVLFLIAPPKPSGSPLRNLWRFFRAAPTIPRARRVRALLVMTCCCCCCFDRFRRVCYLPYWYTILTNLLDILCSSSSSSSIAPHPSITHAIDCPSRMHSHHDYPPPSFNLCRCLPIPRSLALSNDTPTNIETPINK